MKYIIKKTLRLLRINNHKKTVDMDFYNSDLYVVEFPKSGITWFTTILLNVFFIEEKINLRATYFNLEQFIGDVNRSEKIAKNRIFPYYRIIKSHEKNNKQYRHVIYLLRNPFSVMESYYKFLIDRGEYSGSFNDFIRHPVCGVEGWIAHVESWVDKNNKHKMHLLKYEDLRKNELQSMKDIFFNLGVNITDESVKKSIELSEINEMKKSNSHYRKFSPFTKYSFIRTGKLNATIDNDSYQYIYSKSFKILEEFYPELIK